MNERSAPQGDDHGGNISRLTRKNCSQLFFVYGALMGKIEGMTPMSFLQKSGLFDRNVTFVRDPHSVYFDKGVSDQIPTLDAVLDWHKDHLAANPHVKEVYCLGNSFGGWAALFFGYMLGVDKVWALAPAGVWGRKLLVDLMAEGNGTTEYDIHYSGEIKKDRVFAESLDNYPGVRLVRKDEHGHLQMNGLLQSGELPRLLPPFKPA